MENLSHSRHPNRAKKICGNAATKSLYDDVYGGPPKLSAAAKTTNHLSPRMEDYSEIFGGFQASRASSIPVLDLPAFDESEVFSDVRSLGFDYDEVFGGGFEGLDFALSYEDLINGNSCHQAWSPAELESMSDESDISGKNRYFSNGDPQHQLEGNTEFNISYHQSPQMSGEDVTKGMTHVAQLHAVPGYSFMVNSPSQLTEHKTTGNGYLDMDFSSESVKSKQHKKTKSLSYNGSTGGHAFESDLRPQKGQGKDGSSCGNAFLDISKISLRTQPSDLPPPSRPPPTAGGKKGDSGKFAPKRTHSCEGILGDSSPTFFDVEVDATSSAAVSAAAIKEAMEKAQAKLKSAKELMEKRKEGLQSSHKLSSKKHMKENVGGMGKVVDGSDRMRDEKVKGTSERDGSGTKLVAREEKEMAAKTPFEVPGFFHGEELFGSDEKHGKDKRKKESRSSGGSNKVDEASLWKEATEFFEIVTTDEPKKDFEQANCEKILVLNMQINEHEHNGNGAMETSEKRSGNGRKAKTTREDHEVDKFGEKKKLQLSGHEEHNVKSKQASEMKDCGKKVLLTQEVCDSGEDKKSSAMPRKQLSDPNKRITKPDKSVDKNESKKTQLTPIACHSDNSLEEHQAPQKTLSHETVETKCNQAQSKGRKNEVVDKNFKASCTTDNEFMDDAQEPLPLSCSVESTSGEIKSRCEVSEELGVFEIENLLVGEDLKAFGRFPENLDATELAHVDNQMKNIVETGSVVGEPPEQVKGVSPKGFDSNGQERELTHEYEERGDDCTEAQVSINWEDKDSTIPTRVVNWRSEDKRNTEEAQSTMVVEKKNQKSVHQVDVILATEIQEKAYEEVDSEREKGEREPNIQRLPKVEEEKEREREREVKQKNQKSAQQVKASQTTDERKEKTSGEVETERTQREQELDYERLRKVEEEMKREAKQKIQKSAQLVSASKSSEREEKAPGEFESDRKKREREMESERLRRIEEEKEREREREKDRMAVDLATLEARERAFGESREKAERVAVERATAEARQRAMAEARERLEKACAEAREKSLAGKTAMESRIRAERAAVERATAEARERAAGKAMAERTAFEAKDRVQRSASDKFSASSRNNGMKQSPSSSDLQDLQFSSSGVSRYQYSSAYGERCDQVVEGESAQRCKARLERHRRTAERAAKALAEKNMRDLLAQREQAERNRLAETLGAEVKRWSSGKEGNLRALLSTLQYILGPDSGWQPIPLTEVITSVAVKKAYRKATLCVHPDKLQQRGASIHQKYVCEKVFDLLKEAWNKFNSEER